MHDVKYLIISLITIDIFMVVACVYIIRKIRLIQNIKSLEDRINIFKSLLNDADRVSGSFSEQIKTKYNIIKKLNSQLDRRIDNINVLLNRADMILSYNQKKGDQADRSAMPISIKQKEIAKLDSKGCNLEEIAEKLLIPKGEVKLILDLNKKTTGVKNQKN